MHGHGHLELRPALYDAFGYQFVMDFDLPCDIFSEMHIEDLEMGPYTLTLIGRDVSGTKC